MICRSEIASSPLFQPAGLERHTEEFTARCDATTARAKSPRCINDSVKQICLFVYLLEGEAVQKDALGAGWKDCGRCPSGKTVSLQARSATHWFARMNETGLPVANRSDLHRRGPSQGAWAQSISSGFG
jgi:hypothetical protein